MIFSNRKEAADLLAERIRETIDNKDRLLIVGIPRGGVILAYEIAKKLGVKFSILIVKKIPSPFDRELGIGAISEDGTVFLNKQLISELNVSDFYIKEIVKILRKEIDERASKYGLSKNRLKLFKGKNIVLVDDGIATGSTVLAAIKTLTKLKPNKIIVATPVAQKDILSRVSSLVDNVICINDVEVLGAVGMFYLDFAQVDDEAVKKLISSDLFLG